MLGPASDVTDAAMLYSPTPMKRRSGSKSKSPRRRSKDKMQYLSPERDDDNCSKASNQNSLSSKLGSTVGTVATAGMDSDSDSDCDCDTQSFFSEAFSAISEMPEEPGSPTRSDAEESRKKRKKKKKKKKTEDSLKSPKSPKKKKKKKDKSPRSPKSVKSEKSKKKSKSPKSSKSKKKKVKSKKSPKKSKDPKGTKAAEEYSDDDSFQGESFSGTHRVEPRIQRQEEASEDFPGGPPLWGETDEEESRTEAWEEDKSWLGWEEEDKSYIEETICDGDSHDDGFSYYTIQSHEDLEADANLGIGFPEVEDIEDDEVTESTSKSELTGKSDFDKRSNSEKKRVCFNECETVHETLHICDFTQKEIKRSWYQQKDYEETIQGVKDVACSSETPRDTQTKLRRQRSLLSKTAETRGLEAWTPSGVQRFRYVKEAAFRAVWDEQQKQLDYQEATLDDESDISTVIENQEKLAEAYARVSLKSLNEAQMRAKKDQEIAAKLQPRLKKRGGRRGSWEKSMGTSGRRLLDGSDHGLSDNPALPPSCLLKREDHNAQEMSQSEHGRRSLWFGEISRGLVRQKSDRSMSTNKPDQKGLFRMNSERSDRSLFGKKPERGGLFRQSSDRSIFKKKPERGLFRQMSDRGMFNKDKKPERGLFRQASDRSVFKKKSGLSLFNKNSSDHSRSSVPKGQFDPIKEDDGGKPKRRSSDIGRRLFKQTSDRGLVRAASHKF